MGATTFSVKGFGTSVQNAFRDLQQEAEEEYGHQQGYSGEINCTDLTRDITSQYKSAKDKNAFINKMESEVPKRESWFIRLKEPKKNTNKIKSKVTTNPQKGARRWETRYVIYRRFGMDERSFGYGLTQGEAIKKARKLAEDNRERYTIYLEKVLVVSSSKIADVEYKQSGKETQGEYLFLVCAPE